MKTFSEFILEKQKLNWKRALAVGGTTIAASAAAGATKGGGLPGAGVGAGIGALYYVLSGNLKKDLKKKPGDWNYNKK